MMLQRRIYEILVILGMYLRIFLVIFGFGSLYDGSFLNKQFGMLNNLRQRCNGAHFYRMSFNLGAGGIQLLVGKVMA